MPRLEKGRSDWDLALKSDTDDPIYLTFDRKRSPGPFSLKAGYVPNEPGSRGSIALQEWTWSNGASGAGTTIETPESYAGGASEYGENVWLRRKGAAMPAGALVEIGLPLLTKAFTSGQFCDGMIYGVDLFLTTLNRTVVGIPYASHLYVANEKDFGAGTQTEGLAVFDGTGDSRLYVGEFTSKIREYSAATGWLDGEANTGRGWLKVPYWAIGTQLATGGESGNSGKGAHHLVGTDLYGRGFYHVSADPKVAANWSSLEMVGNGGKVFPIQKMVASNRVVWFGTGRGVISVDELGYSPNMTQWMELSAAQTQLAAIEYWNGLIWGAHEMGLMVFSPDGERIDIGQFVNFGARTGAGPIFGRPVALAPSLEGLYVGYYNASTDVGYVGILLIDQDGSYRWSMAEAVLPGQIPTFIQQASDINGAPGLFIGTVDSATRNLRLWRQFLPRYGDPVTDVENGGPFQAATDWTLRLSRWNAGRPIPKTVRELSLESDFLGSVFPDNTVDVQVAADGSDFVTQGTATETRWSGTPSEGLVRVTNLQLKFNVHNATRVPVVIHTAAVRYTPHPKLVRVVTYPIIISDEETGQNPGEVLARLEQVQDEGPIKLTNIFGRTEEGIVEPGLNETINEEASGKGWVVHADVTISTIGVSVLYDDGVLRDTGAGYG